MQQDTDWLKSISKVSNMVAKINDGLRQRVSFKQIDGENGGEQAEIVWEKTRKWQKKQLNLKDDCSRVAVEASGVYASRFAYQQTKDRHKIALNCPDQVTIELDQQTLEKVVTPRGLGIAVLFGGLTGLMTWILAFLLGRIDLASLIQKIELPLSDMSTDTSIQPETPKLN